MKNECCIIEVRTEFDGDRGVKSHCGKTIPCSTIEDAEKVLDELLGKFNSDSTWFAFCPGWVLKATHRAVMEDVDGKYWGIDVELDYYVVSVSKREFMAINED